jgi:hypothetical protein
MFVVDAASILVQSNFSHSRLPSIARRVLRPKADALGMLNCIIKIYQGRD